MRWLCRPLCPRPYSLPTATRHCTRSSASSMPAPAPSASAQRGRATRHAPTTRTSLSVQLATSISVRASRPRCWAMHLYMPPFRRATTSSVPPSST
nr:MAG TPA: hypothetical protein [Caudoviricetes sp.]